MKRNILVLSFDMETDIGSWTNATRGVAEGTPKILRILERHRVPATFLFTGREARRHPEMAARVLSAGHEIGCHTMYHETVGAPVYDVPVGGFALEAEIEARLTIATETIEKAAGARPVSFRAPRLFGSTAMIRALAKLGYRVDSSFPAYYHGRAFAPYHPSPANWAAAGNMRILEVPLFYDTAASGAGQQNRGRDQWPMLRLKGAARFLNLCRRMFAKGSDRCGRSVLCVYLHPWEFVKMPEKIHTAESTIRFKPFLYRNTGAPALAALDKFLGAGQQAGWEFLTLRQLAKVYGMDGAG